MPLVRDYTDSVLVNKLSDKAEILFARLLTKADVNGNYIADPVLIKSNCFPRKDYRISQISTWLNELATEHQLSPSTQPTALLRLYETSGKQYLHISGYGQKLKWKKGLYPPPERSEVEAEVEEETEVEAEVKAHAQTPLPLSFNKKQEIPKADEWRMRTVENAEWVKQTAALTKKPEKQVKEFCEAYIQRNVLSAKIEMYRVQTFIKWMLEDLEKQKTQLNGTVTNNSAPYVPKEFDRKAEIANWWKIIVRDFKVYKNTGHLIITGAANTFLNFENARLIVLSAAEKNEWIEKAKELIIKRKSGETKMQPAGMDEYRKIKNLGECIEKDELTKAQQTEINIMAMTLIIRDFYDKTTVEEFEGLVGRFVCC